MLQVFSIGGGITVKISGLTIQNGYNASGDGGGISNSGTLFLSNCIVSGNLSGSGNGGGITNTGSLTVTNCSVHGNSAPKGRRPSTTQER